MNVEKKEEQNCSQQLRSSGGDVIHQIQDNCITSVPECQSLERELKQKWNEKKSAGEPLVLSFLRLGLDFV